MPSFLKPKLLVHISHYSSQPDVQILCDSSWGSPDCRPHPELPSNVYHLYEGQNYTFYDHSVTCPDCARAMIEDHNAKSDFSAASQVVLSVIDHWQWADELDVLDSFLQVEIESWRAPTLLAALSITYCTPTRNRAVFRERVRERMLAELNDSVRVERLLANR